MEVHILMKIHGFTTAASVLLGLLDDKVKICGLHHSFLVGGLTVFELSLIP